jgi:DNA-binding NarL/FixJ family response regulator
MTRESPAVKRSGVRPVAARAPAQASRAPHPQLTARQADVVELAMLGLTNRQIAERLNVSTHAIKFNLASAYRKLAVTNRTQAAVAYFNYTRDRD